MQGRGDLREVDGIGHQAQGIAVIACMPALTTCLCLSRREVHVGLFEIHFLVGICTFRENHVSDTDTDTAFIYIYIYMLWLSNGGPIGVPG